ncbi:polyprenyl synthetase family protein [Variovorax sp. YR216]|uniref:polyprenyl synthetase family protein n=1 Tax=Variovorax sp. YR216 TaxID=1882828 RepID=UPI00089AD889|nr:polyprenyl synthetase family protein [Variovorax sp. YR216]SEB16065.1 geranylgeranyl diphosphate synthase, type II [Variovorax sp. YR216]
MRRDDIPASGTREPLVDELLSEYGAITREALHAHLRGQEERPYLDALLRDYPMRGGKMLRSTLCIAAARAFGAEMEDAVPSAVAIELMHNALLIHDDIQDASEQRRGRPTLHMLHGVPLALNAGDALSLLSVRPLKDNTMRLGPMLARRILEETEHVAWETTEGQALELGWRRDNRVDITEDDYLLMVLKKTCWLTTIHPLRLGGLIGTRGKEPLDRLFTFGFLLGATFQIQDDVLNLEAHARYGKEQDGDLAEGKRTLMVIEALRRSDGAERDRAIELLQQPVRGEADVQWLHRWIERHEALDYARSAARALAGAARYEYEKTFAHLPDSKDRRFLWEIIPWTLDRVH